VFLCWLLCFSYIAFSLDKPIVALEYREDAQKRQAELVRQVLQEKD
jgi:hypothetical protein